MKIEEAINQTRPFRNPQHKALVNLVYTNNWVVDRIKRQLKPYGVTPQQYNVLRVLKGAGEPISTSVIRDRLLDKMADTSRMVDRLHQKGLVVRQECKHDKRLVDVTLSSDGEKLIQQMKQINFQLDDILGKLSNEDAEVLNEILDKIRS